MKIMMKRCRPETKAGRWKQHSLLLVASVMLYCRCDAFQSGGLIARTNWSLGEQIASRTAMSATKQKQSTATRKKPSTKVVKTGVRGKQSKTGRNDVKVRRRKAKRGGSDEMSRYEMLRHKILTAEEEQDLGRKVKRALEVKEQMTKLEEEKYQQRMEQQEKEMEDLRRLTSELLLGDTGSDFGDEADDDLEGLSVYGIEANEMRRHDRNSISYYDIEHIESNDLSLDSAVVPASPDYSGDVALSQKEIVQKLGIPGGRKELTKILVDGALARETLISSNVRLVVSIAKKWFQQASSNSGDPNDQRLRTLYAGSWTRPSLDEAIQEGILGLSVAAERFEPERKLKFGTYATYWITNSVRRCFQNAATGCLRVPPHYHVLRQQYQRFVKQCYDHTGRSPTTKEAAKELGLTEKRLRFVLKTTESLISMDSPAPPGTIPSRGGTSGALEISPEDLVLSNTIACMEPLPQDKVDMSLLRQCLENAMATELSPHERDVLRLRHGLDDGVSRSAREVVELCGGTLSVSDIRTAELRAFRKLRSPYSVSAMHLLSFLDHVDVDASTVKPTK